MVYAWKEKGKTEGKKLISDFFSLHFIAQDLLAQFGIRSPFTLIQRQSLDNAYLENKYPSIDEKKVLASSLGISVKQVTIWFQNRRQKDKSSLPWFVNSFKDILATFGIRNISHFSTSQRHSLEQEFSINNYPSTEDKKRISAETGITEYQVNVWFQNRRQKEKLSSKRK